MHDQMNVKYQGFLTFYMPSSETYGTLSGKFISMHKIEIDLLKLTNIVEVYRPCITLLSTFVIE